MIELKDVHYQYATKYETVEAVRGVDYTFVPGRFYTIQGASGCGKTTLLSLLAALDVPSSGQILFDGKDSRDILPDKHRRENVSVIYQNYNLLPQLTVVENVMYPMELAGVKTKEARERALKYLEMVGLSAEHAERFPVTLSGGQQQRVAIARALGSEAKVILADEPSGALDKENTQNVIRILGNLAREEGYLVIVVTHDMAVAECADVRILMEDGKML